MNLEKVTVARADGNGQVGHFSSPSADTYLQLNVNVELNRTYTLHGYIKSAGNGTLSCLGKSVGTTASWNHFSIQIVPNSKIFNLVFSPGEFWFYNFKLEKGTIMTQWSPNGEDLVEVKQHIVTMGSSINQLQDKITQKVWMTDVNTATGKVDSHVSTVEQTANKINWLVKSGTDSSNMALTDNAYSLIAKNIDLTGKVKFSSFDTSTQSRLTPLKPTRTWTSKFTTIGTITTCSLSDFNRTPVVGDIFSNTDGGLNTGTWQVTVVNGNSVTIKLLSCDAPAKSAADAASEAAKKAKAISDNIYSTNTTTINGGKITTGSITADSIAANAITSAKIIANAVTADKISVKTLSAINANLGTITAGSLSAVSINNGEGTFKVDSSGNLTASKANIKGKITSNNSNTLYSTVINDGNIYTYGNKNKTSILTGVIASGKPLAESTNNYDSFTINIGKNADALSFGIYYDEAKLEYKEYYVMNNGKNPNGITDRHIWYGTEYHGGTVQFNNYIDIFDNALRFYTTQGSAHPDNGRNFVGQIFGGYSTKGIYNFNIGGDVGDALILSLKEGNSNGLYVSYIAMKEQGLRQKIEISEPTYISTLHLGANAIVDSDRRLKKDITSLNINKSSKFIYSLNPVSYKYKENDSDRFHHGLIAQEIKQSMGNDDWGVYVDNSLNKRSSYPMLGIRYEELIADIIATLQSQNNRIKFLETQIPQLQNQILQLQNQLNNINGGK